MTNSVNVMYLRLIQFSLTVFAYRFVNSYLFHIYF